MAAQRYAYILTLNEKYWQRLCERNRSASCHVFIRRSQVAPKNARRLLFYVTKKRQVLGVADFAERLTGDAMELWEKFGGESCFASVDEYKAFADGRDKMTFIRFQNLREIAEPASREALAQTLGSLARFRLGQYLDRATAEQLM